MENRYREVSFEKFKQFINSYPRKLEYNFTGICEPPLVTYTDFELSDKWPDSVVAKYHDSEHSILMLHNKYYILEK